MLQEEEEEEEVLEEELVLEGNTVGELFWGVGSLSDVDGEDDIDDDEGDDER